MDIKHRMEEHYKRWDIKFNSKETAYTTQKQSSYTNR